jgi:hypothetical protein
VLPLSHDLVTAAQTDARGEAEVAENGFLHLPSADAFALGRGGRVVSVTVLDHELPLRERGFWSRYTYDTQTDLDVGAPPPAFPMQCTDARCDPVTPIAFGGTCTPYLVTIGAAEATASIISPMKDEPYGALDVSRLPASVSYVVVALCRSAGGRLNAAVSDPMSGRLQR